MTAEEPSIAVVVERLGNLQKTASEIKTDMVTKETYTAGRQADRDELARFRRQLGEERAERVSAVATVKAELLLEVRKVADDLEENVKETKASSAAIANRRSSLFNSVSLLVIGAVITLAASAMARALGLG